MWRIPVLLSLILGLAACGGGGGGGGDSTPVTKAPITSDPPPAEPLTNVLPITVNAGLGNSTNLPFASVTVCTAGNANQCQTIDNIIVDTGSYGLRILASALPSSINLQQVGDPNNFPIVECAQFADGPSWGPVKIADVTLGSKTAGAIPIQVIGDPAYPNVPEDCSNTGPLHNTVETFGANGVLGVGVFSHDCGDFCVTNPTNLYFICPPGGVACQMTTLSLINQVQNPVALFSTDNNGVVITLPAVPAEGAATVNGSLIFGIGTESNNAMGNARVFPLDANGNFSTLYNGQSYTRSFLDSGSNALFIHDDGIPLCSDSRVQGFYCPNSTLNLTATIATTSGANGVIDFSVANALQLLVGNPSFYAFSNLAAKGPLPNSFSWGLPFFFGRTVFTALENRSTPGGNGPYVAY